MVTYINQITDQTDWLLLILFNTVPGIVTHVKGYKRYKRGITIRIEHIFFEDYILYASKYQYEYKKSNSLVNWLFKR